MEKALDESMALVGEIIEAVCKRMVVESAAAYVYKGALDLTTQKVVKRAVEERLSRFNQMTLHTINSLTEAPTVKGNAQMCEILRLVKEEALHQAGYALPKEMQLLDKLVQQPDAEARRAWLAV